MKAIHILVIAALYAAISFGMAALDQSAVTKCEELATTSDFVTAGECAKLLDK